MNEYEIAIIGGGAAGLYLAAALGGFKTVIIERGARVGKKLSATGNGQGNVANANAGAEHYFTDDFRMLSSVLESAPVDRVLSGFNGLFVTDEQGRIYPAGRQASSLTDCLRRKCERVGVKILTETRVTEIQRGFTVKTDKGVITADKIVFCTGGKAQKQFGTDGSVFGILRALGHTVTPLYPSLVQLKTNTEYIKTLKGIRAECAVTALCGDKLLKTARGDVIFTEYGVSGNAIFAVSPYVTDKTDCALSLEFLPDVSETELTADIEKKKRAGYDSGELLALTLNNQIGRAIIKYAGSDNAGKIAYAAKHFRLSVLGTLGFDYAQVTRGGVPLSEMTENLESKFVKGMYFAGETLNVDGECGGYNLHWAFASALRVARALTGGK